MIEFQVFLEFHSWFFGTLFITFSSFYYFHFSLLQKNYSQIEWPVYTLTVNEWWDQKGEHLPLNRINRFGYSSEILNLQWMGDLTKIQSLLQKNGWEIAPTRDWITVLHRISDVQSTEHIPLVSPLYLDKKPVLILTHRANGNKKLTVLRLWDSHILIKGSALPLWVGTVTTSPRTYSWLFNPAKQMLLTPQLLFIKIPSEYEIKAIPIKTKHRRHSEPQVILLIKPR